MKIALPIVALLAGAALWRPFGTLEFRVSTAPMPLEGHRVGVNLGSWTNWGAEQLSANVLKNPGFEPTLDRAIVVVRSSDTRSFTDDTDWLARPDSFWDGGVYSIRTGVMAGRKGAIAKSTTAAGFTRFETTEAIPDLQPGDVIAVSSLAKDELPALWWYSREGDARIAGVRGAPRPGGAGVQSLRLTARGGVASASSYLDAIGDRAGKLLPLTGGWQLSFWVRSGQTRGSLRVTLRRDGRPAFLDEHIEIPSEWKEVSWHLASNDDGPAGIVELRFETADGTSDILLDDVSLRASAAGPGAFRGEAVAALKTLRPGYLRDWQGQLGDSLENRLAGSSNRRPFRYRPGGPASVDYGYSLPDFLELCGRVHAIPWVVLPTTLGDEEWIEAGRYLSAEASRFEFREIVIEFGNENWNMLFRPAGIPARPALAAAAERAFRFLREGSGGDRRLTPLVGESAFTEVESAPLTPGVLFGIAPYWAFRNDPTLGLAQLFPDRSALLQRAARNGAAIYEMNAHTLGDSGAPEEASRLVTSRAAGSAMAWHSLAAMAAGIPRQCAYVLAGFDTFGEGRERLVRLFGLARDLSGTVRLRPTGMALSMLNRAVGSQVFAVESGSEDFQAVAFRHRGRWRLAVASRRAQPSRLLIRFPSHGPLPSRAIVLGGTDPYANNEEQRQVSEAPTGLAWHGRTVEVTLPAFGFAVLLNEEVKHGL